jgi:hypothetical protein
VVIGRKDELFVGLNKGKRILNFSCHGNRKVQKK